VDAETSWRVIEQQRLSLADLLDGLTDEQWNVPSLCHGWRVKDVAAHVAMTPQPSTLGTVATEFVRARGSLTKATRDIAVRFADRPGMDLVAEIREHAASRRLPIVTNYRNIVLDILVHGQDIAIPLGIARDMPTDAVLAGLNRAWKIGWLLGVDRSLRRFTYTATDVDWTAGDGPEVTGSAAALLLVLTGRAVALPQLTGPGVDAVAGALRR
jgi:uncharacterized protein (TIGR03083 family)